MRGSRCRSAPRDRSAADNLRAIEEQEEDGIARNLIAELGRRRVLQVAVIYAAIAWSITEVISFLLDALPVFPQWSKALIAIIFIVGFPVAMFLAWRFDIGPGGIKRTEAATTEGRLTIIAASLSLVGATGPLIAPFFLRDECRIHCRTKHHRRVAIYQCQRESR